MNNIEILRKLYDACMNAPEGSSYRNYAEKLDIKNVERLMEIGEMTINESPCPHCGSADGIHKMSCYHPSNTNKRSNLQFSATIVDAEGIVYHDTDDDSND